MLADDLVGMLKPEAGPGTGFRQGQILTWDPDTGHNTVSVGGSLLTDVPVLNTSEAIALKPGHVVGLLTFGGSWFILGRITPPGDPNFAGASLEFATGSARATNFTLPLGTPTTKVSLTLAVPAWADEAAVVATSSASLANPRSVADFARMRCQIAGAAGYESIQGFAVATDPNAQYYQNFTASYSVVVAGPGSSVLVESQLWVDGAAWSPGTPNVVNLTAFAVYRSNV